MSLCGTLSWDWLTASGGPCVTQAPSLHLHVAILMLKLFTAVLLDV